jgi:hypothetical protein
MPIQHLLFSKARLFLLGMVLLYLLVTTLGLAGPAFGEGSSTEKFVYSPGPKDLAPVLVVGVAMPLHASGSGILNELESLLALPLLYLIWACFFFRRLPDSLFQKPAWRLPFLQIHRIFPNGP